MNFARIGLAGCLGVVATVLILFFMHTLVNVEFKAPEEKQDTRIANIQMPKTEIETRYEAAKPEKPEEPHTPPPQIPEPEFEAPTTNLDGLNMEAAPSFESNITMSIGGFSGDGEYLPIVKVAPEYPSNASSRGIEGFCTVEFTVTVNGSTKDVVAIDCTTKDGKPTTLFNRASIRAAERFKYRPKVVDGVPIEVPGVRNRFVYELAK